MVTQSLSGNARRPSPLSSRRRTARRPCSFLAVPGRFPREGARREGFRIGSKARRGYTLVEIMMTIAILGILISIGSSLIIQVNKVFILSSAKTQLQQEARAAMYVMTRELRQAQNQSISISRYNSSQPPCSMITFTKIQGNTVSFYQDGNELVQKTTTSTSNRTDTTVLAQDLAFMAFIFPNSSDMTLLSLGMTLQKTIYQGQLKALHMASQDVNIMD